jgi:hypothetical protein
MYANNLTQQYSDRLTTLRYKATIVYTSFFIGDQRRATSHPKLHYANGELIYWPCIYGSAFFMVQAYSSNLFSPSLGDAASPNCLTIALPMITPSAPHSAIWPWTKRGEIFSQVEKRNA